jgi:hypothetical protein
MLETQLRLVRTPYILYVEDDWEFLDYPPIWWDALIEFLKDGRLNYIRLFAQNRIHPLHEHMMRERVIWDGVPFILHQQWSQNPHLSTTQFYNDHVLPLCKSNPADYIENVMHGTCQTGEWKNWKLATYNPVEGATMAVVRHIEENE